MLTVLLLTHLIPQCAINAQSGSCRGLRKLFSGCQNERGGLWLSNGGEMNFWQVVSEKNWVKDRPFFRKKTDQI